MARLGFNCRTFMSSGIVAAIGCATAAHANDRSLLGVMIPPSSCEQRSGGFGSFAGNAWTVEALKRVTLDCPLPVNNVELGGTASDNDISKFRIHYQRSDRLDVIAVQLIRSQVSGGSFTSSVVCGGTIPVTVTGATTATVPCVHDVAGGGTFYQFAIVLDDFGYVADPRPVFIGIDFPP